MCDGEAERTAGLLAQGTHVAVGVGKVRSGFTKPAHSPGAPWTGCPSAVSWWRSRAQGRGVGWGCGTTRAPGPGGRAGLGRPAGNRLWDVACVLEAKVAATNPAS